MKHSRQVLNVSHRNILGTRHDITVVSRKNPLEPFVSFLDRRFGTDKELEKGVHHY